MGNVGGPYIIAGNKDGYVEDLSVWAKSIFVGLVARGFPAKDDVVNEIIVPDLRCRRFGFSFGGVLYIITYYLSMLRDILSAMQVCTRTYVVTYQYRII